MTDEIRAYPLSWPDGWRRARSRIQSNFGQRRKGISIAEGCDRVLDSLQRFGAREVIISTNVQPTLSGRPRSNVSNPYDPGVAIYWKDRNGQRRCMAIDRYIGVSDNLAAISATLEAMRTIDRHGGAEILDRAFTGFVALPSPEQWWQVLGVNSKASRDEIDAAYRRLAHEHHPDRGGSHDAMARINAARDQALESHA